MKLQQKSNLEKILSVFAQNKTVMYKVIVPTHNNGHYVILDVIIPSVESTNGDVFISNYLDKEVNQNNLRANMW